MNDDLVPQTLGFRQPPNQFWIGARDTRGHREQHSRRGPIGYVARFRPGNLGNPFAHAGIQFFDDNEGFDASTMAAETSGRIKLPPTAVVAPRPLIMVRTPMRS